MAYQFGEFVLSDGEGRRLVIKLLSDGIVIVGSEANRSPSGRMIAGLEKPVGSKRLSLKEMMDLLLK